MILYQLCCEDGHDFEVWFRDGGVYDALVAQGRVECPYCGSSEVIESRRVSDIFTSRSGGVPENPSKCQTSTGAPTAEDAQKARDVARRILNAVGKIQHYAETHYEDANVSEDEDVDFFRLSAPHRRDH